MVMLLCFRRDYDHDCLQDLDFLVDPFGWTACYHWENPGRVAKVGEVGVGASLHHLQG